MSDQVQLAAIAAAASIILAWIATFPRSQNPVGWVNTWRAPSARGVAAEVLPSDTSSASVQKGPTAPD